MKASYNTSTQKRQCYAMIEWFLQKMRIKMKDSLIVDYYYDHPKHPFSMMINEYEAFFVLTRNDPCLNLCNRFA